MFVIKNQKGFTITELVVIICIISVLSSLAIVNYIDIRRYAADTTALSDARALITAVQSAIFDELDIDYSHSPEDGPAIGTKTNTPGQTRPAILRLSEGVKALLTGSKSPLTLCIFTAKVSHVAGTNDPFNLFPATGNIAYFIEINEETGDVLLTFPAGD